MLVSALKSLHFRTHHFIRVNKTVKLKALRKTVNNDLLLLFSKLILDLFVGLFSPRLTQNSNVLWKAVLQ